MKMALDCWLLTRASAGIPRRLHEPCREVRAPRWMQCSAGTDASESRCCGLGCRVSTADHVPKYHAAAGRQQCGSLMKQSRDGTGEAWPLFFTDGCTTRRDSDGNALFWRHVSMRRSSRGQSPPVAASRSPVSFTMQWMPHFGWPATIAMGAMMHSTVSAGLGVLSSYYTTRLCLPCRHSMPRCTLARTKRPRPVAAGRGRRRAT
jgi:hypothetical protein